MLAFSRGLAILQRMGRESSTAEQGLSRASQDWVESCCNARVVSAERLPGGAGARRYVRVRLTDGASAIWMHALPEDPEVLPPALRTASEELPFVQVTEFLAGQGLPVPQLYGVQHERRWVLLEDLGDQRLCDLPRAQRLERQRQAAELLARVHLLPRTEALPFTRCFDAAWIRFELDHFQAYGTPPEFRDTLVPELEALIEHIGQLPQTLCLRDFQSQNLMIDAAGNLRILDYQDALLAPPELDLAAFLYDSYVEISEEERGDLLERYAAQRGQMPEATSLALLIVQRKCKDYARFRYLSREKHDARFTPFEAAARQAVLSGLARLPAGLEGLRRALLQALAQDPT